MIGITVQIIGITVQIVGITVQIVGIDVFFVEIDDLEQLFIFIGIRIRRRPDLLVGIFEEQVVPMLEKCPNLRERNAASKEGLV